MRLTNRALMVKESATLAIASKAIRMKESGIDVISLSAGEPDFPTPDPIAEAGVQAIRAGKTKYTSPAGTIEARRAVCTLLRRDHGLDYRPEEILITAGAKPGIHVALMAAMEVGDAVVVPAPFWVSYPDIIRLAGGEPHILAAVPEQGFVHRKEQLLQAVRDCQARGLIFNSPNNPSGAVHTRQQVRDLVEVAEYEDLWIISDEIYGRLLYDGAEHVSPAHFPEGRRRTFLVNGPSKTYAMTGWRLGFLAGPEEYIQAAYRIQSQITGNTCTPGQWAATEAFANDHTPALQKMLTAFDARRRLALDLLAAIPRLRPTRPSGAFYIVVDVRPILKERGIDDVQMAERLLEDVKLALVPGAPFALPGFIRISYAASEATIREGIRRLAAWING